MPPHAVDDDLVSFVAALTPESTVDLRLEALKRGSILAVAAYVRLGRADQRGADPREDLIRADNAYSALARLVGSAPSQHLSMLIRDGYVCLRPSNALEPSVVMESPFEAWLLPPDAEATNAVCWRGNPFESTSPEMVAAKIAMIGFKRSWSRLRPAGQSLVDPSVRAATLIERPDFRSLIVEFVVRHGSARRDLLTKVGLRGSGLDNTPGQPRIVVITKNGTAHYTVEWGAAEAVVEIQSAGDPLGTSIQHVLADPEASAYEDLQRDLEAAMGSAMFSHATRKPASLPWDI